MNTTNNHESCANGYTGRKESSMVREVYGKNGDSVVVMDVRDLMDGEYTVDLLIDGGYQTVYTSSILDKCIAKAKDIANASRL